MPVDNGAYFLLPLSHKFIHSQQRAATYCFYVFDLSYPQPFQKTAI